MQLDAGKRDREKKAFEIVARSVQFYRGQGSVERAVYNDSSRGLRRQRGDDREVEGEGQVVQDRCREIDTS